MGEKLYGEVIQQDNLTIKREKCVTRRERDKEQYSSKQFIQNHSLTYIHISTKRCLANYCFVSKQTLSLS